jgi:hypothetical protein
VNTGPDRLTRETAERVLSLVRECRATVRAAAHATAPADIAATVNADSDAFGAVVAAVYDVTDWTTTPVQDGER